MTICICVLSAYACTCSFSSASDCYRHNQIAAQQDYLTTLHVKQPPTHVLNGHVYHPSCNDARTCCNTCLARAHIHSCSRPGHGVQDDATDHAYLNPSCLSLDLVVCLSTSLSLTTCLSTVLSFSRWHILSTLVARQMTWQSCWLACIAATMT